MDFKFRKLQLNDFYKDYLKLLEQLSPTTSYNLIQFNNIFDETNDNNTIIMVLEIDNKIMATGTLIIEQKFIKNGGKVGHIEDIVVDSSLRGKNIGKKLIEELTKIAFEEYRCYKVILDCLPTLQGFYEKCGYTFKNIQMSKYKGT